MEKLFIFENGRIDISGLSQVKSHEKRHKPGETTSNQRRFEIGQTGAVNLLKNTLVLGPE